MCVCVCACQCEVRVRVFVSGVCLVALSLHCHFVCDLGETSRPSGHSLISPLFPPTACSVCRCGGGGGGGVGVGPAGSQPSARTRTHTHAGSIQPSNHCRDTTPPGPALRQSVSSTLPVRRTRRTVSDFPHSSLGTLCSEIYNVSAVLCCAVLCCTWWL